MSKQKRHSTIHTIIKEEEIVNQDTLLNRLTDRGFEITQATLSRDIKELKIVKAPTVTGIYAYQASDDLQVMEEEGGTITSHGFINIEFAGQLAVIKTRPGYAMAIATEVDKKATDYILGTVAGDDTILIILKENKTREEVKNYLANFIPNLK